MKISTGISRVRRKKRRNISASMLTDVYGLGYVGDVA
jgi:DNA-binding response OmpR family regulator